MSAEAKKSVRISRRLRKNQTPREIAALWGSFLCLLALALTIKPLANEEADYIQFEIIVERMSLLLHRIQQAASPPASADSDTAT